MRVHRAGRDRGVAPHVLEERAPRDGALATRAQRREQLPLEERQVDLAPGDQVTVKYVRDGKLIEKKLPDALKDLSTLLAQ